MKSGRLQTFLRNRMKPICVSGPASETIWAVMAFRDATVTMGWVLLIPSVFLISVADGSLPSTWLRQNDVTTGTGSPVKRLTLNLTPISCAHACSYYDWCSIVVTYGSEGNCELLESKRSMLSFSPPDTRYTLWEIQDNNAESWCPVDDGFEFFPAVHFCFLVVENMNATWIDSRSECRRRNLELVVPDTTFKMRGLIQVVSTLPGRNSQMYYIGATRPVEDLLETWEGRDAYFNWNPGSHIDEDFLDPFWGAHQPNNDDGNQNCLTISGPLGFRLNDYRCNAQLFFICEKRR